MRAEEKAANKRRRRGARALALSAALALAGSAAPAAPSARAAAPTTIAEYGQGAGRVANPVGVSVDQSTGDLYVADAPLNGQGNSRIDKFDAEGDFLLAWGFGVADGVSEALQTCGPQTAYPRCFGSQFTFNYEAGNILPDAVAVDQSSHDVYVADANRDRVTKFGPEGEFLLMVGRNVDPDGATQEERDICTAADLAEGDECGAGAKASGPGEFFGSPEAIAVDAKGRLWVIDGSRVVVLDSSGHYLSEAPVPGARLATALALDAAEPPHLYALELVVDEAQRISFAGFGEAGGSLTLANLPAPCSASSTDPIELPKGKPEDVQAALNNNVGKALRAKCDPENLAPGENGNVTNEAIPSEPTAIRVGFREELGAHDWNQLTCTKKTGAGSCAVATLADGARARVEKLEPSGDPPSSLAELESLDEAGHPRALAQDAAGGLYVGDCATPVGFFGCSLGGAYRLLRYDSEGELSSLFGAGQVFGHGPAANALAVDEAAGALYAASGYRAELGHGLGENRAAVQRFFLPGEGPLPAEARAEDVLPTSATLAATLNPEGHETHYRFQYLTQEAYEANLAESKPPFEGAEETPEETLPGAEYEAEGASAEIDHLIPETEYRFRIVAENEAGTIEERASFASRPAVAIEAQWASSVAARDAALHASLDPLGVVGEWWLEYGASPCSEGGCAKTAKAALPASFGALSVGASLGGLQPATAYRYRFAATDVRDGTPYTVHGPEQSFATQPGGLGFALADGRAWEMVSPPDKHGGAVSLGYQGEGQVQGAANGEAAAYLSAGSLEAEPEGNRSPDRSSVLSRRGGGGSWNSRDIATPNEAFVPSTTGVGGEYKLFSADLESALVEPRGSTPLAPAASERTPYVRANTDPPTYTPLVSGCPAPPEPCPPAVEEGADVPAGTEFGGDPLTHSAPLVQVAGATSGLDRVAISSSPPLAAGAASDALYEWSAASPPHERLAPLSVLPAGEGGAVVAGELGSRQVSVRGAIAAGGSRVFWSSVKGIGSDPTGLYLRDAGRGETLRLDTPQPGAFGTGAAYPLFQGASADGTVAFFTDTRNLTEDASEEGDDLYRCEVAVEGGVLKCDLSDLTSHEENPSLGALESAEVQGVAAGVSEDGRSVYFVAKGALAGANAEGASPAPGQPNLYLWQRGQGVRFIATLSPEGDALDWGGFSTHLLGAGTYGAEQTAAASPGGRYLAFMSALPLSGNDNRDARSGEADQEVFRYDAQANGGQGGLLCASCAPAGARPAGLAGSVGAGGAPFSDRLELWSGGEPLAANLPEATKSGINAASLYRPRAVADDGRLFFNAADSLVPADSNGTWDVYEYEPSGLGSCSASSADAGTALTADGCVSLISSGTGSEEAGFLDASEDGSDVFFFTSARLSALDEDEVTDVYDARVGGVPARVEPVAECLGEACQPPATPPPAPTPASAAFRGPGNLRESAPRGRGCPKGERRAKRRGKARCAKKRHRARHDKHRHGGAR